MSRDIIHRLGVSYYRFFLTQVYKGNCDSTESCEFIWNRRRLLSTNSTGATSTGDVTLFVVQDWRWSYLFKTRQDARAEVESGWTGGLNFTVLKLVGHLEGPPMPQRFAVHPTSEANSASAWELALWTMSC